jgi:hypothetical protein
MQMDLLRVGRKRKSWIAEESFVMVDYERKGERENERKNERKNERATRDHVTRSVVLCGAKEAPRTGLRARRRGGGL